MKLWTTTFDKNEKSNFPQIVYKNRVITIDEQTFLTNKIFDLFQLTHRDKLREIQSIKKDKMSLPYKALYNLIMSDTPFEFETEYMVFLLNFFSIEVD